MTREKKRLTAEKYEPMLTTKWLVEFKSPELKEKELTLDLHAGEFEAFLYSPTKQFLGIVRNEIVLLDFLCKVAKSGKTGYYLVYNGKKYPISKNGRTNNLPIHYLDDYLDTLLEF